MEHSKMQEEKETRRRRRTEKTKIHKNEPHKRERGEIEIDASNVNVKLDWISLRNKNKWKSGVSPPTPPLPLLPPKNGNALFFIFQCGYFYFEHKNKEEMIFFALHRAPPLFSVFFFFPFIFAFRSLLFSSPFPFFPVSPFPFWLVGWLVFFFSFLVFCFFACAPDAAVAAAAAAAALAPHWLRRRPIISHTHTHTHTHRFVGFTHTKKKTSNEERKGQNWEETKGTRVGVGWTGRGGAMWVCIQFSISFISLFSPCLMAAATRRRIDSGTRLRVCASECVCIDY